MDTLKVDVTMGLGDDFPDPERATEIDAELLYSNYKDVVELGLTPGPVESALMLGQPAWNNAEAVSMAAERAWTTSEKLLDALLRAASDHEGDSDA